MKIKIRILRGDIGKKHYTNDAGFDLYAKLSEPVILTVENKTAMISTGLAIQMPHGVFGMIVSRSSMSNETEEKSSILCHQGIVDGDFNGTMRVVLSLVGNRPYTINNGDRIAQIIFLPRLNVKLVRSKPTKIMSKNHRGSKGFGSTGK